jgi:DNA repair protein RadD
MTAPALRPYQAGDITRIRASYASGARCVLYQAPTGSGKTVLFSEIVRGAAARGNRVVILGHRDGR